MQDNQDIKIVFFGASTALANRMDYLVAIPKLIQSIRDDYSFYIDYYTIIADEIVIYAI